MDCPLENDALEKAMVRLGVREEDLREQFIKGGGPGGQKINKTASCVSLKHLPTGLEIRCQASRSLAQNRLQARFLLCERLDERRREQQQQVAAAVAKQRRKNRRPSRRAKARLAVAKRKRSDKKRLRRRPSRDES